MLKQCKICEKTKFDSFFLTQFNTQFMGLYTWVSPICKSCARNLRDKAVRDYCEEKD